MQKLITVRHGHYNGGHLTPFGQQQIEKLAETLANTLGDVNGASIAVLSSAVIRAIESAEIIAKRFDVKDVQRHEDLVNDEYDEETHVRALEIIEAIPAEIVIVVTHLDAVPGIINAFRKKYFVSGIPRTINSKGTANLLNLKTGEFTLKI